jgi:hypothetical protein
MSFTVAESKPSNRLMIARLSDLFLKATPVEAASEKMEYSE